MVSCNGIEDEITLRFSVAGHTKNRFDAAFGLVKRRLKQFDAFGPSEMMRVLNGSSVSNKAINATVDWVNWKKLLKRL